MSTGPRPIEILDVGDASAQPRKQLPIFADDIASVPVWERPRNERRVRAIIIGCACLIFLPNLGAFGLWDPWETHYGTVTTEMLDTYDWISPWWGYRGKIGSEPTQGKNFYSKPIFIFWSEAIASRMIGRGEWAIRLPMAMLAILAVFITYLSLSKIWTRRVGVIGALVVATSPQFFMISRQAQTDMPFVATMVMALCFLMLAFFGPREPMSNRRFKVWLGITLGFLLLNTLPQYGILINDLDDPVPEGKTGFAAFIWSMGHKGTWHALYYAIPLVLVISWYIVSFRREVAAMGGLTDAFKDRWIRRCYLVAFYVLVAHSTYSKGLLGFGLPGAIILLWLVVSGNWRVLLRAELVRGIAIFCCTGLPWYVAMLTRHGTPYWNRFFIHDHFNRLGSGVHQIDSGTFEHFIKWLGVGTFPWVAFVPLALFWALRINARDNGHRNQAKLFVSVWFLLAFTLFTLSSTKFHHYIFPAMPALAVLLALFIDHLLKEGGWLVRASAALGVVFLLGVGWDIHEDPQSVRNLMTYKYDRAMPKHLPIDADGVISSTSKITWKDSYFYKHTSPTLQAILQWDALEYKTFIRFLMIAGVIALCLFFVAKTRMAALIALGGVAALMAVWSLNYYLPSLTPHWSQKYLFDAYYDTCTQMPEADHIQDAYEPLLAKVGLGALTDYLRSEPKRVCDEDIISWLIVWRGETYYSYNELKPVEKKHQFLPYLEDYNGGKKFYLLMERGKVSAVKSELKRHTKTLKQKGVAGWSNITDWTSKIENEENQFFITVSMTPTRK